MVSDSILGRTSIMYEVNSKQAIPLDVGRPKARQRDGKRDESCATSKLGNLSQSRATCILKHIWNSITELTRDG